MSECVNAPGLAHRSGMENAREFKFLDLTGGDFLTVVSAWAPALLNGLR